MEIVTGKRGFPHVSSYEMQAFNNAVVGDSVLFDVGNHLQAEIVNNNLIHINSGCIMVQGVYCIIPNGTYDEIHVDSVNPGTRRKDVIYIQYERDLETGLETVITTLAQGEPVTSGEPVAPTIPQGATSLWEGGRTFAVPLYVVDVTFNAISVSAVYDFEGNLLTDLKSVAGSIGDTSNLTTTNKESVVSAVNEVNGKANTNASNIVMMLEDVSTLQGRMTTAESDIDTLEGRVSKVASETNYRVYEMLMGATSTGMIELAIDNWTVGGIISNNYPVKVTFQAEDGNSIDVSLLIKNDGTILGSSVEQTSNLLSGVTYAVIGNSLAVTFAFSTVRSFKTIVTSPVFMTVGFISNPQTLANTLTIDTSFNWSDIRALTNSANVATRRVGTNITGNGRLIIPAWTENHDRNEIVIRFVKRASNGYVDVVIPLERGQVFSGSCRVLFNGGVGINRIYETVSSASHIFDFEISNTESYDVFMSAPIYIGGSYGAQTSLSGTEMTLNVFDYSRADYVNGKVGDLNNLLTIAKSNMVNAVNEVVRRIGDNDISSMGDGTITGAIAFSNEDGEEVSGNPITITDAIDANAVDVSVDIEPVQDLHGYDKPWVGGAGKNKLPMTVDGIKSANTSGTWSGNVYSKNNGTFEILTDSDGNVIGIKVNGTFNANTAFNLTSGSYKTLTSLGLTSGVGYLISGCPSGGSYVNSYSLLLNAGNTTNKYDDGSGLSITVNDSDTYMIQVYIRSGYNAQNLTFYPMIRLATETDSSFAPYSNICPISAVTETGGEPQIEIQRVSGNINETYIIKTGSNVYGGTFDVTSGELTVTHGYVEYDGSEDETWLQTTGNVNHAFIIQKSDAKNLDGFDEVIRIISNEFKSITPLEYVMNQDAPDYTYSITLIVDKGITVVMPASYDASSFKTWLANNPLQIVYELDAPQTIQLTPIQVKMLKGTNTVSSNAQTINLSYLKDNAVGKAVSIVEKEIEPQIEEIHNDLDTKLNSDSIAPVENGDTASTSYAVGSYIVRNNNLYKVISAISVGATFTSNNIQQTTVMAEILSRL